MTTTKKTKKIEQISIKMTFVYSTNLCIAIISHPKSTQKAKDEASAELLRYAVELDRISNLTK